jgi:type VI secretion system protein ImpL
MHKEQLLVSIDALVQEINQLQAGDLETYPQFRHLSQSMSEVQCELAAPELQAVADGQAELPADLSRTLDRIFSPRPPLEHVLLCDAGQDAASCANLVDLKLSTSQLAGEYFADSRNQLLEIRTETTGPLLAATDDKLQYSSTTASLQKVLTQLLGLPFAQHEGQKTIREMETGKQLFWDSGRLQGAHTDKLAYDTFDKGLAEVPANLQEIFEPLALSWLDSAMADSIGSAQRFEPLPGDQEEATFTEARKFGEASAPLDQLLKDLLELDSEEYYQDLSQVSTTHALTMLARIDHAFDVHRLYQPLAAGVDHLTGATPPSLALYGAHNATEMQGYIALQKQQAQQFVAITDPLVTFLAARLPASRKQAALFDRWQGIVSDVKKNRTAPPSSGQGALEDFLQNQIDKPECQASAAPPGTLYFLQVRRSLERTLASSCYNQFAEYFNRNLEGKFPFTARSVVGDEANTAEPAAQPADPAVIAELYRQYDANKAGLDNASAGAGACSKDISGFLRQLAAVRPLVTAGPQGVLPALDFVPAFRVNRGHEINGNQIIDWSLQSGDQVASIHDANPNVHWIYGQPVKLTLRWAKDALSRPVAAPPAYGDPVTRTVVFEYNGPWALLSMLAQQAGTPSDFDHAVDPAPQTLAFSASQQSIVPPPEGRKKPPAQADPAATQAVRVFIQIKLLSPDGGASPAKPMFPARAPVTLPHCWGA